MALWNEHENQKKRFRTTKTHLFFYHVFQRKVLMSTPMNCKRINLEPLFIAVKDPKLNEQKDSNKITLLRNGVNLI